MSDSEGSSTPKTVAPALRMDISAVSLKIPPFWPADPEVCIAQVKATFTTHGISVQRTKFDHTIASLLPEDATEVRDLPSDNPYDVLRDQLIRRTAALGSVNYNNILPRSSSEIENPHSFLDACNNFLVNTIVLQTVHSCVNSSF